MGNWDKQQVNIQRVVTTLRNRIQSCPIERDFKTSTAAFQDEDTDKATFLDISSDRWKRDWGIFSTVYPNLP